MTTVTLIEGDTAFSELAGEWDGLAGRGITDTPFQQLAYQKAWWTHLRPNNATLMTLVVRDDSNTLQAIACLYNIEGVLYFNGCVEETDYLDLITTSQHAETGWNAVLEFLHSNQSPVWHRLNLCNIPEASPTRAILADLSQKYRASYHEEVNEVCPIIFLSGDFDTYLESLDSKQRREISRKMRRADAAELTTATVGPEDEIAKEVDDFLDLLQRSTFEKREWLNDGRRAVFHDVARWALEAGTLQLLFSSLNGRKVAALFNFDYRDRIWVYNSGLDPSLFSALSPGVVLTTSAIQKAIELGRTTFDFLRGNEEYKYRFGAVDTRIFRIQIDRQS